MFYLVQPLFYRKHIKKIIQKHLHEHDFDIKLEVIHSVKRLIPNRIYFIVNDSKLKKWDGLKMARAIRKRDHSATLILISNEVDYSYILKTHLAFLGVVETEKIDHELPQYIDYLKTNT